MTPIFRKKKKFWYFLESRPSRTLLIDATICFLANAEQALCAHPHTDLLQYILKTFSDQILNKKRTLLVILD